MTKHSDISIDGRGFYQITAQTAKGRRFMTRVQGHKHGVAYSDDSRLTQEIADGAVERGLHVEVNGQPYGKAQ